MVRVCSSSEARHNTTTRGCGMKVAAMDISLV
jgi:hypothetical protein